MEKLIELLNEYQEGKSSEIRFKRIDNSDFFVCGDDVGLGYETILSKKFGFIKWLVENDKIERLSFAESGLLGKYTDFELSYDTPREDYTNMLLMELSIQDDPIKYLISVLR